MGKYQVLTGQSLFDIALHVHGSIEGIVDLLISNPSLSLASKLKCGEEISFTDGFVIDTDIAAYYKLNGIVPANGERTVYYKQVQFARFADVYVENTQTSVYFCISGSGTIEIDWGDNSNIEEVTLDTNTKQLTHSFDNSISEKRNIRLYGELDICELDFSGLVATRIYLHHPLSVEKFILNKTHIQIDFLPLLRNTYEMKLHQLSTDSLFPLLHLKGLMRLDLSDAIIKQKVLDEYLIGLVRYYYERRSCMVHLTCQPSGVYREPDRDENLNYILTTGMEAVWVLTHEPSWNEAGHWQFTINETTFSYE